MDFLTTIILPPIGYAIAVLAVLRLVAWLLGVGGGQTIKTR